MQGQSSAPIRGGCRSSPPRKMQHAIGYPRNEEGCNTWTSEVVAHPSTTLAQALLIAEFLWYSVYKCEYDRTRWLMRDCATRPSHATLAALHGAFGPHMFRDNHLGHATPWGGGDVGEKKRKELHGYRARSQGRFELHC